MFYKPSRAWAWVYMSQPTAPYFGGASLLEKRSSSRAGPTRLMYGFHYHFNNLCFNKSQTINDCFSSTLHM